MKLLFDQNLSPRLLADIYPESIHVREINFLEAQDIELWNYAKQHGFAIVSKDKDFQQRCLLFGHPPKVIWLRVGNCPFKTIENLLRKHSISIHTFANDDRKAYLILP